MKKWLSLLAGLLLVFVVAGSASAVPITFDLTGGDRSYGSDYNDYTSDGLTMTATVVSSEIRYLFLGVPGLGVFSGNTSNDGYQVDGNYNSDESIIFSFLSDVKILSVGFDYLDASDYFAFTFNNALIFENEGIPRPGDYYPGLYTFSEEYIGDEFEIGATGNFEDFYISSITVEYTAPVPEPATILLFGIGLLGLAGVSRKKE